MHRINTIFCILFIVNFSLAGTAEQQALENFIRSKLGITTITTDLPCGFSYSLLLRQYWFQLDPRLKRTLGKPWFDPPLLQDSIRSPAGRFMLHFDRSGSDAVPADDISGNGIPDYIDSAAVVLDYVYQREVIDLGFQAPLDIDGQPVTHYHVYFQDLGSEYGSTFSREEIPGPADYFRYTSYTILENDYSESNYYTHGLNALKITAAHEFHHAVQLSTRIWWQNGELTDLFLMEMTSSWLEDVVYEDVNDYLSDLPYLFQKYSNKPFNSTDYLFPYGNGLFLHMLEKQFGVEIGTQIWERIKEEPGLDALASVLRNTNTSFLSQLHQYGIWLYYTGTRADTDKYFPEGALYPQLTIHSADIIPFNPPFTRELILDTLASRLLHFNQTTAGEYSVRVNSSLGTGMVSHLAPEGILNTTYFDQEGILFLRDTDPVTVLLSNPVSDAAEVKYTISIGSIPAGRELLAFPNPVVVPQDQHVIFANIPQAGEILILNSNGERIVRLVAESPADGVIWNLKDDYEQDISSGVYLYFFKGATQEVSGKIAIVR